MKRLLFSTLFALTTLCVMAQNRSKVSFYLFDEQSKQPLQGAVIEVSPINEPADKNYYTTGREGYMEFSVPVGEYSITATFIGYADKTFSCKALSKAVNLGKVYMRESATKIDAVVKEVHQFRTTQNADTLIYNASAFKTTKDAEAEKLLSKMPGVVVEDGQVEVQGEQIKKVFVDGDEFFGDDVTMAIKNIPAEIVDKVEVFDKLSDEAEFSGIDDGDSYKALNFVTKKNMRNGLFGKGYVGIGWQPETGTESFNPKYLAGGNFNSFRNKQKITVLGLFNNINQQNFSFEDLLGVNSSGRGARNSGNQFMVRPQAGIALVNAIGLNYSDTWGRRKQVKFQGSYFFNNTNTRNLSERTTWYESPAPYGTLYSLGESQKINNNHRLNARIDWRISRSMQLVSRTSISYQGHSPSSQSEGYSNNNTDLDTLDMEDITFRSLAYNSRSAENRMRGINANEFLQYRIRLGAPGRTMTITARAGYRDNRATRKIMENNAKAIPFDSPLYESLYDEYFGDGKSWQDMCENPLLFAPIYEYINVPTYTYNLRGGINYNEPIARNWTFTTQYNFTLRNQSKEQEAWYSDDNFIVDKTRPIESLSINSSTNTMTHRVGPGIRYAKNRNTFVFRVLYENLSRNGKFENGANISSLVNKQYHSVQYHAMFRYAFNKQNSLRIQFRSNSDAPSVTQLHNIFDAASPQNISVGNSALSPEYSHSGSIRYILSLPNKGQTFMAMIRGEYYQNYISNSILYNAKGWKLPDEMNGIAIPTDEDGNPYRPTQITSYENISGMWSVRGNISYGVPLSFMKCNLNMAASVRYSVTPSAVYAAGNSQAELLENVASHNYSINKANNIGYTFRLALGSNISENIDFTISWRGTYNQAWNSITKTEYGENIINNYFRHTASASVKWIFGAGFTLTANAAYHQYLGFENNYNEHYILCNLYLGKQLFKNRRGEVLIGVNDILNQNTAFSRTTGSGYTRNVLNSTVGRYVMVQFVYNLRHFGKNASRNIADYEGMSGGTRKRPLQGAMGSGMQRGRGGF